ncbi:hypothetical protein Bca4012_084658 [Brassica carinata]|uniref:Uncharacterized protein n=1 Tax=Brassica carinata TaxID=52824 RepID=A0A8X7SKS4_BRACI|nr:hypothetical protein Bca52824_026057 [Brassica carinata]
MPHRRLVCHQRGWRWDVITIVVCVCSNEGDPGDPEHLEEKVKRWQIDGQGEEGIFRDPDGVKRGVCGSVEAGRAEHDGEQGDVDENQKRGDSQRCPSDSLKPRGGDDIRRFGFDITRSNPSVGFLSLNAIQSDTFRAVLAPQ